MPRQQDGFRSSSSTIFRRCPSSFQLADAFFWMSSGLKMPLVLELQTSSTIFSTAADIWYGIVAPNSRFWTAWAGEAEENLATCQWFQSYSKLHRAVKLKALKTICFFLRNPKLYYGLKNTPSVPNYKSLWLFLVHTICYVSRHIIYLDA